jgi:peptidyl-prolyl isomerase E (cyclophilin E)
VKEPVFPVSACGVFVFVMEEGSRNKKTIFVGGLSDDVEQTTLIEAFNTFGDIIDVQIPLAQADGRPGSSVKLHNSASILT